MAELVTLEDYKVYVEIQSSDQDDRIAQLITSVSQAVKSYCGRTFVDYSSTPKTEVFDILGDRVNKIFVDEIPIINITSVKERSGFSSSWDTLYDDGTGGAYDYYANTETGVITRINDSANAFWPEGPARVEVVYTAGYTEVPEDLKLGVFDLVRYYHKREHIPRQTVQGITRDINTKASKDGQASFPDHITRILDLYKL